jgi:hypothetical protein
MKVTAIDVFRISDNIVLSITTGDFEVLRESRESIMAKSARTEWMSVPAAARLLGIGTSSVLVLIAEGRLTTRKIPPSYQRILRAEVEALAEASTIVATGAQS